jgi:hypothetical protein
MKIPNPVRFAGAMLRIFFAMLRGQRALVPPCVASQRLSLCETCSDCDRTIRQCNLCTCFIDIKTQFATEMCPKKKWRKRLT